jgi:hypothetical protein
MDLNVESNNQVGPQGGSALRKPIHHALSRMDDRAVVCLRAPAPEIRETDHGIPPGRDPDSLDLNQRLKVPIGMPRDDIYRENFHSCLSLLGINR